MQRPIFPSGSDRWLRLLKTCSLIAYTAGLLVRIRLLERISEQWFGFLPYLSDKPYNDTHVLFRSEICTDENWMCGKIWTGWIGGKSVYIGNFQFLWSGLLISEFWGNVSSTCISWNFCWKATSFYSNSIIISGNAHLLYLFQKHNAFWWEIYGLCDQKTSNSKGSILLQRIITFVEIISNLII